MWDMWWTKWQWSMFFPELFGCPCHFSVPQMFQFSPLPHGADTGTFTSQVPIISVSLHPDNEYQTLKRTKIITFCFYLKRFHLLIENTRSIELSIPRPDFISSSTFRNMSHSGPTGRISLLRTPASSVLIHFDLNSPVKKNTYYIFSCIQIICGVH
jgi:hypothetical protein